MGGRLEQDEEAGRSLSEERDGWKLLQEMVMNERGKDEAVTARAKAKAKRVTSARSVAGASEMPRSAQMCSAF